MFYIEHNTDVFFEPICYRITYSPLV